MARRRESTVKYEIIQAASSLFLERGFTKTAPSMISNALNISPGSLTYYFPTKENLLAVFIEMLADYQWGVFQKAVDDGETPITALCFELTAMVAMCEDDEVAKDLYISAYTKPLALSIVRKTDEKRARTVFAEYCPDWTDEQWAQAEMLVSGLEYSVLNITPECPSLPMRIAGAMNSILMIYGVPEERRKMKIEKALSMDYRKYGQHILNDFKAYVTDTIEKEFDSFVQVGLHFEKREE